MTRYDTHESADSVYESRVLVQLDGATKRFGGTVAISDVSFDIVSGEVLALLGENGAGKSTCVKVLAGVYHADQGSVVVEQRPVTWRTPLDAQAAGIAVMHQHPGLFPDLSVAENIYFGHFPRQSAGTLDHAAMRKGAAELLALVGLAVSADQPLSTLSVSEQQLVEVARALSADAQVLIMDEPTAALSQREVEKLFAVVERLKARGVGLVFVGHRMDEIFRVSDKIAVLRDGCLIGVERTAELSREEAINMMVGRTLSSLYPERNHQLGDVKLELDCLSVEGEYSDVSFSVRAGEIVGVGGLVGSGRTEVARTVFGITQPNCGQIRVNGQSVSFKSPAEAMRHGVSYVSENRLEQSLIMEFPIRVNGSLTVLEACTRLGLIREQQELDAVRGHLEALQLRYAHFEQPISDLSGGNQQKVVLSKWLATEPGILILDEPTQGIDVQSKAMVHKMMSSLAESGLAIILISSEMPELLGMCDRVVVMQEGRLVAEFNRDEANQEDILKAATGQIGSTIAEEHEQSALSSSAQANSIDASSGDNSAASQHRSGIGRYLARREAGLFVAILVIVLPVSLINPRMLSATNLTSLTMDAALLGLVALGQMLVILTRNIDLSVASVIGLAAYAAASLMAMQPELPVILAVGFACLVGAAAGAINGLIIAYGGVPSIVATLGTMSVFRGAHSLWADGDQISADEVPASWLDLAGSKLFNIPVMVVIAAAILAAGAWLLSRTQSGREIYAAGSNPNGAQLVGIPVARRVMAVFVIAGTLAGLMGALWASRYATVDARVAFGYELTVIAAVVVGGVAIRGGYGTVTGIILGAITLLVIRNGLTLVRVDPLWLQGIYGLVILIAITIDARISQRSARLLAKRVAR